MVNDIPLDKDIKIIPPASSSLKISDKDNMKQNKHAEDEKQRNDKQNTAPDTDQQATHELASEESLPLVQMLIKKRNLEQENLLLAQKNNDLHASHMCNKKIADINAELKAISQPNIANASDDINVQMNYLSDINKKYNDLFTLASNEASAIDSDDDDALFLIIKKKAELLDKIDAIISRLNIVLIRQIPSNSAEKAKAEKLFSDIHSRTNKIMIKEDENHAALKGKKAAVLRELETQKSESKIILKYSILQKRSHFVNTKK